MEKLCEKLCHWPTNMGLSMDDPPSALYVVLEAMGIQKFYDVTYPFKKVGEVYRVSESRICELRFWLVAGEGELVFEELTTYCESPEVLLNHFSKLHNAFFVITAWTGIFYHDPDSKSDDQVEASSGRAWSRLPLAELPNCADTIWDVVDDVARGAIVQCWTGCPEGAKFIADCAAHFNWKDDPQKECASAEVAKAR